MNYSRFIIIWLISALFSGILDAQTYAETERKERSFKTSNDVTVEVFNKYGIVHVETWEKDSVKFIIDLKVEANNNEKLNSIKESILFDFTPSKYKIQAKTIFNKARGLITEFVDAFVPSTTVIIDYTVIIPKNASLKIDNKFGNIYLDDIYGNADISLSNGDITAKRLLGNTTIRHSSGDSEIDEIKTGKIFISYADMNINKVGNLTFDTRSSRIDIQQADYLKIKSSKDKYNVEQTNELYCEGSLTTLSISKLRTELNATLRYGGAKIDNISRSFHFLNLSSEYADIDLYFERNSSYNLDITHHQDAVIQMPRPYSKIETKELNPSEKLMLTYGTIGLNVGVNSPKLKITALKKCIVNIIHKK